jgi:predicted porin
MFEHMYQEGPCKRKGVVFWGLQYAKGPVFVGFSHQSQKQRGANGVFSAVPGFLTTALGEQVTADLLGSLDFEGKTTYNLINGSYDFGVAKVLGGYNQVKQTVVGLNGDAKAKEYNLGVEVPVSTALKVGLGYARSNVEAGGQDAFDTTGYSAAAVYSLSKRTALYAALTSTKLESADSNFSVKSQLVAVGVNHSF